MSRRLLLPCLLACALVAPASADAAVRAGAAAVDASWHVGATAGSHGSERHAGFLQRDGGVDPTTHSTLREASYGLQSRMEVRAVVVEGPRGNRIALVKNDLFIPQDLLYRRTAQLLEESGKSGITRETLTMAVSHDHSSPYYSSAEWGVWLASQDILDVRFFDYYAKRMAKAVEKAAAQLVPVRVGAAQGSLDDVHRNSMGPTVGDDGTPAGFPSKHTGHDLNVVRFDDVSNPQQPKPVALILNYSLHPEFLRSGYDLLTADYVAPLQRMVDRSTGAVTIFTQNAVGTAEPEEFDYDDPYDQEHSIHERNEFHYRGYSQAEAGARKIADEAIGTWRAVARPDAAVPFSTDFQVAMEDRWFAGPLSHPYPGVSSCRTDPALAGNPRAPILGLPDCQPVPAGEALGIDPGITTDDLQGLGVPVPENLSAPSYTGLQEDLGVHLQAFRLGDIFFPVCSCEQWFDQSENVVTRTDQVVENEYLGLDYSEGCEPEPGGTWRCPDPRTLPREEQRWITGISDAYLRRMRAQVRNDAAGWDQLSYLSQAESEPTDPQQIKGNYTHDDDERSAALGYKLTVPIAMANDYNGYIATYREYMARDSYRKALTAWGPHSSDYMATRMVQMGRHLNGGPDLPPETGNAAVAAVLDARVRSELVQQDERARAIGELGEGAISAYEAILPDDGGEAEPVAQPEDVERFSAAYFTWNGGSNFTDNPVVRVQRRRGRRWLDYADQSGELPVTVRYPTQNDVPAYLQGGQRWEWTAHFEAFVAPFDPGGRPPATPAGEYRFVVEGQRREGGHAVDYSLTSQSFEVRPWTGITVDDLRLDADGQVSFTTGPRNSYPVTKLGPEISSEVGPIDYPDSYASPARYVRNERFAVRDPDAPIDGTKVEWYCFECSFRPWLDADEATEAWVTILDADGAEERVPAWPSGDRWIAMRPLGAGESAFVASGDVRDAWGNTNGASSPRTSR